MLVDLHKPSIFFKELLPILYNLVSLHTKAQLESIDHLLFSESRWHFPHVFISLSIVVMPQIDSHSFLIVSNINQKSGKINFTFNFIFYSIYYICSLLDSLLSIIKYYFKTLFDLFSIHQIFSYLKCSLMRTDRLRDSVSLIHLSRGTQFFYDQLFNI